MPITKNSDNYIDVIHQKVSEAFPGAMISKSQIRTILKVFNTYIFFILKSHCLNIFGEKIRARYLLMKKVALKK